MCGIFGGIGPEFSLDKVKTLAVLNQSRGMDGGGLWNHKWFWKGAGPIKGVLDHKDLRTKEGLYLLGHTRAATTGAATERNAHPFQFGKIMGAHNGTVANWIDIAQSEGIWAKTWVDSEVIFYLLDKYGLDGLKRLEAYWGLIWTDTSQPDKVFVMSHDHMVHMAVTTKAVYISSDDKDLARIGMTKPFRLKDDWLYTVDAKTCRIEKQRVSGLKTRAFSAATRKATSGVCSTTAWGGYGSYDSYAKAMGFHENKAGKEHKKPSEADLTIEEIDEANKAACTPLTDAEWERLIILERKFDANLIEPYELDQYEDLSTRMFNQTGTRFAETGYTKAQKEKGKGLKVIT